MWPLTMLLLGVAGIGVCIKKGSLKNYIFLILLLPIIAIPFIFLFISNERESDYFLIVCIVYAVFFAFIFWEVMRFLLKPGYINIDIITAAGCGFLLLIEICTFLMQYYFYQNPNSIRGIDTLNHRTIHADIIYFSCIVCTSTGFGDIVPNIFYTKLVVAFIAICAHFYSVVLVGVLISKFVSKTKDG